VPRFASGLASLGWGSLRSAGARFARLGAHQMPSKSLGPLGSSTPTLRRGEQTMQAMAGAVLNARTQQRASFSGKNKCARCGVHAEQFRKLCSPPRTYTLRDAWCALSLTSAHGFRCMSRTARAGLDRSHPLTCTHFPPPGASRGASHIAFKRRTQPALKLRLLSWWEYVPVTLLGECALSRGRARLHLLINN
jgi:hypothetical protein